MFEKLKKYLPTFQKTGHRQRGITFDARGILDIPKRKGMDGMDSGNSMAIYRPSGSNLVDPSKAMDSYTMLTYAAVSAICDEIANTQFRVYQIDQDGEREELLEHEILDVLDGVNENMTGAEFKHMVGAHLELAGNCYILLEGVKNFTDKPTALYLLNPGAVQVILDKRTYPYKLIGYKFTFNGKEARYQPYEIVHLKYPNPNDPWNGIGTVQGIAEWIDLDNYLMDFNKNFFKNGARLNGVLETQMTGEENLYNLKISFEEQYAGVKNAYKTVALPKGVEFKPTQAQAKDMDFPNLSKETFDRVLAGFRVSRTILGTAESDTNRATAETADYVFAKRTIKPKMRLICSYLNEYLIPRYADDIYIEFVDPVPEDKAFRTQEMQAAVGNKPVITQNEARETFMGLGPVEDPSADDLNSAPSGDKPVPPTSAPAGDGKNIKKAAPSKKAVIEKKRAIRKKPIAKTQFSKNLVMRSGISKKFAEELAEAVKKSKVYSKSVQDMDQATYEKEIVSKENQRISEFQAEVIAALRKINHAQKEEVLKNLEHVVKTAEGKLGAKFSSKLKAIDVSRLLNLNNWVTLTVDALTPILSNLFGKQGATAAELIGQPALSVFDNADNKTALDDSINLLSQSYNDTVVDALKSKIDEGLQAGLGYADITARVQDIFEFQNEVAAERVAKTEVVRVSNMANKAAWQDSGTVKTVKWYTSEKDNVCPFCENMNGTVIPIADNFFDQGETLAIGDDQVMHLDYSDVGGPPLHPNCGCYIRPDSFNPIE